MKRRMGTKNIKFLVGLIVILAVGVAVLLLFRSEPAFEGNASSNAGITVSGILVDNYGEHLEYREVYVNSYRAKTDEKGRFKLVDCEIRDDFQVRAELSRNHWPPHESKKYMSYRYYVDVVVDVDYQEGVREYEVKMVAERPEFVIEVRVVDSTGQTLPYFPTEIRCKGGKTLIPSQWAAERKLTQRTDKQGYCKFTEVPNVEGLKLVMWGGGSVWNDPLNKEQAKQISDKYQRYRWTEVPIEVMPGKKEYKVEPVILTNEEYETNK